MGSLVGTFEDRAVLACPEQRLGQQTSAKQTEPSCSVSTVHQVPATRGQGGRCPSHNTLPNVLPHRCPAPAGRLPSCTHVSVSQLPQPLQSITEVASHHFQQEPAHIFPDSGSAACFKGAEDHTAPGRKQLRADTHHCLSCRAGH